MTDGRPVLVTGAAGFIGRRLCRSLRLANVPVRAFVRPGHDADGLLDAGIEVIRGDAAEATALTRAAEGCGVVYHLAAARGVKKLPGAALVDLNRALLDAAASASLEAGARLVFASTVAVMEEGPDKASGTGRFRPMSTYGASRARSEQRLASVWRERGLDYRIARIAQRVAGPEAKDWRSVARAVQEGRICILPRGGKIHSCDVDDAVAGLQLCAGDGASRGETYILAAREPEETRTVLSVIAEEIGARFAPIMLPSGPFRAYGGLNTLAVRLLGRELPYGFTASFYAAPTRFETASTRDRIGFEPTFTVVEAVRRAARWLRSEGLA